MQRPQNTFSTGRRIGKLKHTDVAFLWVQDEIKSQRLRVHRVRSEENVAGLGTKPLSKAVIAKHCLTLGYVNAWMLEVFGVIDKQ